MRGIGMPKGMNIYFFTNSCFFAQAGYSPLNTTLGITAVIIITVKQECFGMFCINILLNAFAEQLAQGYIAIFVTLAFSHQQLTAIEVNILKMDTTDLSASKSAAIEQPHQETMLKQIGCLE